MPHFAASDLDLHCLSVPLLWDAKHKWDKIHYILRGLVKQGNLVIIMVYLFLFLHENLCCGYSLEAPQQKASYEYPQHVFMGNRGKLSQNYHKMLLFNKSTVL